MIVIVTGGRDYRPTPADAWALKSALEMLGATVVRHGGCRGVDEWSGRVAKRMGLKVEVFPADWKKHGKAAGPLRNRQMYDADPPAGACVALPGGRGTADCVGAGVERGVRLVRIEARL